MLEGASATVRTAFNAAQTTVLKEFKPFSRDGFSTIPDYENEVAALAILSNHQNALPFKVPHIIHHGLYNNQEDVEASIAFIEMTELENPLSALDPQSFTRQGKLLHAQQAAYALAKLHGLQLTNAEKNKLQCSPIAFNIRWLKNQITPQTQEVIEKLCIEMGSMQGEHVFIHNDFHHRNLFANNYGEAISGACDFCCSGMGPKEMDFYPFLDDPEVEEAFLQAYQATGSASINNENIGVVRTLVKFIKDQQSIANPIAAPVQQGR